MNFPVIDLHCDTVLALLGDDMNQAGSLRKNRFHIDLERASRLGGLCPVLCLLHHALYGETSSCVARRRL